MPKEVDLAPAEVTGTDLISVAKEEAKSPTLPPLEGVPAAPVDATGEQSNTGGA